VVYAAYNFSPEGKVTINSTLCLPLTRNDSIHLINCGLTLYEHNLLINLLCGTLSKAHSKYHNVWLFFNLVTPRRMPFYTLHCLQYGLLIVIPVLVSLLIALLSAKQTINVLMSYRSIYIYIYIYIHKVDTAKHYSKNYRYIKIF